MLQTVHWALKSPRNGLLTPQNECYASRLAWLGPHIPSFNTPPIPPCTPYNLCLKTPSQSEKSLLCHILKTVYKGMLSYYHNGTVPQWVPGSPWGPFGGFGSPFLYFRLLEVFAQNWVPFWSPFQT